jgi:hypothetical protein
MSLIGRFFGRYFEPNQAGHWKGPQCELLISASPAFRRFWAVAPRRNSSRASFRPVGLNRSSLRMRLRQHFNFLAQSSRDAAFPRARDLACHVTGFDRLADSDSLVGGKIVDHDDIVAFGRADNSAHAPPDRQIPPYPHCPRSCQLFQAPRL